MCDDQDRGAEVVVVVVVVDTRFVHIKGSGKHLGNMALPCHPPVAIKLKKGKTLCRGDHLGPGNPGLGRTCRQELWAARQLGFQNKHFMPRSDGSSLPPTI